jgi:hypothetical protein
LRPDFNNMMVFGGAYSLAVLASAKNPDGSDYTLPVSGTVTTAPAPAATPTAIASGSGDAAGVAPTANLRLMGYSVRESAASPDDASFVIRHGALASDPALVFVEVSADQSTTEWLGEDGIACPNGIFIDRVSGSTEIVLYTKVAA